MADFSRCSVCLLSMFDGKGVAVGDRVMCPRCAEELRKMADRASARVQGGGWPAWGSSWWGGEMSHGADPWYRRHDGRWGHHA